MFYIKEPKDNIKIELKCEHMHLKVKVFTNAKKDKLEKISEGRFQCFVREKPENNLANKKMLALLAEHLNLPIRKLKITKGQRQPNKIVLTSF